MKKVAAKGSLRTMNLNAVIKTNHKEQPGVIGLIIGDKPSSDYFL